MVEMMAEVRTDYYHENDQSCNTGKTDQKDEMKTLVVVVQTMIWELETGGQTQVVDLVVHAVKDTYEPCAANEVEQNVLGCAVKDVRAEDAATVLLA